MRDSWETARHFVSQIQELPQPLVIIAGARKTGKTPLAKALATQGLGTYINLSLLLSRYLATDPDADDNLTASTMVRLLRDISPTGPMIVDNIEAVFQPELRLSPLRWFRQIARDMPLVVVWPGAVVEGEFRYSMPNRPDYFYSREPSLVVVNLETEFVL